MVERSNLNVPALKRLAQSNKKETGQKLSYCLDQLAQENGFPNWAQLMHSQRRRAPKSILTALLSFLRRASAKEIVILCRGGSIWVNRNDAKASEFTASSFFALGSALDGLTKEAGMNLDAVLFADLDGIQENFVFLGDEDDDGKPVVPEPYQVHYTTAAARKYICGEAPEIIQCSADALEEAIA